MQVDLPLLCLQLLGNVRCNIRPGDTFDLRHLSLFQQSIY